MKRIKINKRILTVLMSCLLFFGLSAPVFSAHAAEMPEAEEQGAAAYAETVIRVKAEEGTAVTVKRNDGSPKPDREAFTCEGSKEKDSFTVRISEPGDYGYTLTVGTNQYTVKIAGVYEETEEGEIFVAKTAIYNPDGTKTNEPTWNPPGDTPFGIADIKGGPMGMVLGFTTVLTALGLVFILRKKEERAR